MKLISWRFLARLVKRSPAAGKQNARRQMACALLLFSVLVISCRFNTFRSESSGMPPQAQALIDAFSKDVQEGRYDKIYAEAADEWRRTPPEQSKEFFATIKEKLGAVRTRTVQTIREQENSGPSLVVIYQTAFERAEGMETFTLVERDGRWLLAGYFVNSSALK